MSPNNFKKSCLWGSNFFSVNFLVGISLLYNIVLVSSVQ